MTLPHGDRAATPVDPATVLRRPFRGPLWLDGRPEPPTGVRVGVIGSRRPTGAQRAFGQDLCAALVAHGAVIYSGGARGVDAVAHRAALAAGAPTVLVSPAAHGAHQPPNHGELFAQVRRQGAVLSPVAPGTPHHLSHYRLRNRVLARAVDAVVVVCADLRSGSLHCAREAWRLGVPVLAVPWSPGTEHAAGGNLLLSAGARALAHPDDAGWFVGALEQARDLHGRDVSPPKGPRGKGAAEPLNQAPRQVGLPMRTASSQGPAPPSGGAAHEALKAGSTKVPIDATGGRWQRYAPAAPRTTGREEQALSAPSGVPDAVRDAVAGALTEAGASLESLVQQGGHARSVVARLLLHWTMTGAVTRDPFGRYTKRQHSGEAPAPSDAGPTPLGRHTET